MSASKRTKSLVSLARQTFAGPHLKYLVVSLRPSSTGVSPTLCFTSQEPFTILGISLKAPLRRSVDSGSSPPATNLPHNHRDCILMLVYMWTVRS